jgi:hypothetical protein
MHARQTMTDAVSAVPHHRPINMAVLAPLAVGDGPSRTDRLPGHARGGTTDYRATYLWLDAGQSWPFLRGLETITNRALCGWLFAVAACACWAMIMMMAGRTRPVDSTVQMERLAEKLERTPAIPAATVTAVARVLGQPSYDCRHVACSAQLADRNGAARARLEKLLADKGPSNALDLSANRKPRPAAAEVEH